MSACQGAAAIAAALFRETIGENGDLYLFSSFLAPMGALAGAYYR